jgi:hypothetical protein
MARTEIFSNLSEPRGKKPGEDESMDLDQIRIFRITNATNLD